MSKLLIAVPFLLAGCAHSLPPEHAQLQALMACKNDCGSVEISGGAPIIPTTCDMTDQECRKAFNELMDKRKADGDTGRTQDPHPS